MGQTEDEAPGGESAAPAPGERLSVGLRGLLSRVERATGSIAEAASRGRERAVSGLRRSASLRHGLAAGERGNLEAALALLREAVEQEPEDTEAVLALWNVALACDRAEVASAAMARWIHTEASGGRCELAVDYWIELSEQAPAEHADAPTLMRMLPELRRRLAEAQGGEARGEAEAHLLRGLRQSVEPEARGLTPGVALRVFEQARFLDANTARRAGEVVLAASDLHEAKRRNVEALLAQLDGAVPAEERAELAQLEDDAPAGKAAEVPAAKPAAEPTPRPVARARLTIEAIPIELSERGLIVRETESGQRTRIDLRTVEAIAVARIGVGDPKPAPLIDLVLRRTPRAQNDRIVRMHADTFDASAMLSDAAPGDDPLGGLLGALLDRSGAVPLPDPDSALGIDPKAFASLEDYERRVLSRLALGAAGGATAASAERKA